MRNMTAVEPTNPRVRDVTAMEKMGLAKNRNCSMGSLCRSSQAMNRPKRTMIAAHPRSIGPEVQAMANGLLTTMTITVMARLDNAAPPQSNAGRSVGSLPATAPDRLT